MTAVRVTPPLPETAGVTERVRVVVCVSAPLVPVIVTFAVPVVAVPDAVKVNVLVPVVEAGLKLAATPAGNDPTLSATLPLNPPEGVTVTVLVPVAPCATVAFVADKEKSGA